MERTIYDLDTCDNTEQPSTSTATKEEHNLVHGSVDFNDEWYGLRTPQWTFEPAYQRSDGGLNSFDESLSMSHTEPPTFSVEPEKAEETSEKGKKKRSSFSKYQTDTLVAVYEQKKFLDRTEAHDLAKDLNLTRAQVNRWFMNRRHREKNPGPGPLPTSSFPDIRRYQNTIVGRSIARTRAAQENAARAQQHPNLSLFPGYAGQDPGPSSQ